MSLLPVYDKYFSREDATYYYNLFTNNCLNPELNSPKESFNAIFGNSDVDLQYILRLPPGQFNTATAVIESEIRKTGLPEDYYLHELNTDELYKILVKPVEWSRQDVAGAKILLEQRNVEIDESQLNQHKAEQKLKEREKQKINLPILVLFYIIAPLGALLPVFGGLIIYSLKDTDVDGKKDFVFSQRYRNHGLLIAGLGILSCFAWARWLNNR